MSRLKKLRKERGFSQIKMQMLTGIDQSDYSKIETGKRSMSFEQCRRVALALETSMDYLAGLTDDAVEDPACLHRIDAIVNAFWSKGIYTPRHDW